MVALVNALVLFVYLTDSSPDICGFVSVDREGFSYRGSESFPAPLFLPFPQVYVDADGGADSLPTSSVEGTIPFLSVDKTLYRDVTLIISLRPYLPDFLVPYLSDYWASWGERIPYVGEWQLTFYEETDLGWIKREVFGVMTPEHLDGVADDLLADADFNGVPSAFWNYKINRER